MHTFPILENYSNENNEEFAKVIGFQVLDNNGVLLAKGETEIEATEKALMVAYLSDSNANTSKPLRRNRRLLNKKAI
ncbi:MAG: hypothetical protein A3C50_01235 [Candidatus Staskawiczbacteria bacterium RIFCSPHIGHO2_02_FULL_43_16]|uniref:Uncharacterized protein n=1 Tax=Candidatus Staskawiczbacteria bacterium RIFCSPHIGHO2_01_FULL_41_41 TaxID=1802203 RepID=A0A1G2HV38_9BACT|nr:MAG: hypothetical protein A2822_04680 [Candidatus Staskawiczbacteria bacterium RIFCSPHIGHO2_01_FULL_41_41]OGZ68832.1 MAG: hypothetical protein A3C50_01235 [Candidatus Staskawiczbacteria bacterium RIFCSPHIGHO2_02_FULL_43_16]OGZ74205.1 MAG: hypothetical protein A3A12_00225 [Candidatus Staskawiczbacteria bacterium RIFCSPLOWO2_01_FULL_43_17b]